MASNIKTGSTFEREFAEQLHKHGFWAHLIARNAGGQQPADIIAAQGNYHCLIDCKVVSAGRFPFSRVEDNQRSAMHEFQRKCDECGWFALKLADNQVWMLSLVTIEKLEEQNQYSLSEEAIITSPHTLSFNRWLTRARVKAIYEG